MKSIKVITGASLAALTLLIAGCGGGQPTEDAVTGWEDDTLTEENGAATYTPPAGAVEEVVGVVDVDEKTLQAAGGTSGAVNMSIEEIEAAILKEDYEKAVDGLVVMQYSGRIQNQQQAYEHMNRMRAMKDKLIDAVNSGDPQAQRAAQLLMQMQNRR